jgi:hypothetical protein
MGGAIQSRLDRPTAKASRWILLGVAIALLLLGAACGLVTCTVLLAG